MQTIKILITFIILSVSVRSAGLPELLNQIAEPNFTTSNLNQSLKSFMLDLLGVDLFGDNLDENLKNLRTLVMEGEKSGLTFEMNVNSFKAKYQQLVETYVLELKSGNLVNFMNQLIPYLKNYITFEYLAFMKQHDESQPLKINIGNFAGIKGLFLHMKQLLVTTESDTSQEIDSNVEQTSKGMNYGVFVSQLKNFRWTKVNAFKELSDTAEELIKLNIDNAFNTNKGDICSRRIISIAKAIKNIGLKEHEKNRANQETDNLDLSDEFDFDQAWQYHLEQLLAVLMTQRMDKVENNTNNGFYNRWSLSLIKEIMKLLPLELAADYAVIYLQGHDKVPEVKIDYSNFLINLYQTNQIPFNANRENSRGKLLVSDYLSLFDSELTQEQKQTIVDNFDNLADFDPKTTFTIDFTNKLAELGGQGNLTGNLDINNLVPLSYDLRISDHAYIEGNPTPTVINNLLDNMLKENASLQSRYLLYKLLNLYSNYILDSVPELININFTNEQRDTVLPLLGYQDPIAENLKKLIYKLYLYDDFDAEIKSEVPIQDILSAIQQRNYETQRLIDNWDKPINFIDPSSQSEFNISQGSIQNRMHENKQASSLNDSGFKPQSEHSLSNQESEILNQTFLSQTQTQERDNIVHEVVGQLRVGDKLVLEKSKNVLADVAMIENVTNEQGKKIEYVYVILDDAKSPCYPNH